MRNKWLIAGLLIIALIVVCGAGLVAVWQGAELVRVSDIRFNIGSQTVSATNTEEKTLAVEGPVTLNVDSPFGDIHVESGPAGSVSVTAEKTAWGKNDQDAHAALEALKVKIDQNGGVIAITVDQPMEIGVLNITPGGGSVKFTITVPEDASVILSSSNGNLSLSGTTGEADLHTSFGNVEVKDVTGKVAVQSNNGKLVAENIHAGSDVSFSSDFGDISLNRVEGRVVSVTSTNGKLELDDISARFEIKLSSQFGSVRLTGGKGDNLEVQSNNGAINLENVVIEREILAHSEFGNVLLEKAQGASYDLSSNNGKVSVNAASGPVKAHSGFGDVEVLDAEEATLDLSTTNGGITFSGSLGDGPHTIKSDFGNISLSLPKDSSLNVDLKTGFGKITSDFSIQISGELDEKHWQGDINDGKITLNVQTNNGNIKLLQLSK